MKSRIVYYDSFGPRNSNYFWKSSFEKLGGVRAIPNLSEKIKVLKQKDMKW